MYVGIYTYCTESTLDDVLRLFLKPLTWKVALYHTYYDNSPFCTYIFKILTYVEFYFTVGYYGHHDYSNVVPTGSWNVAVAIKIIKNSWNF